MRVLLVFGLLAQSYLAFGSCAHQVGDSSKVLGLYKTTGYQCGPLQNYPKLSKLDQNPVTQNWTCTRKNKVTQKTKTVKIDVTLGVTLAKKRKCFSDQKVMIQF